MRSVQIQLIRDCLVAPLGSFCSPKLMKSASRISLWLASALMVFSALAQPSAPTQGQESFQIPATDDGLPGAGPIRRQDWFHKLWAERRSGWAKRIQQDQNAFVFLGDSITQGWGDA